MEISESGRQTLILVIMLLSMVCFFSSFMLFVCAAYVKINVDSRVALIETYNSNALPAVFLFVGIFNLVQNVSLLFICNKLKDPELRAELMKMMLFALGSGIVLILFEFSTAITSFIHISILDSEFEDGIHKAMSEYKKGGELKKEIDTVQTHYKCCGDKAYTDWFRHAWIDPSYLAVPSGSAKKYLDKDGNYYSDDTPYSCCDSRAPRPCIHHHIHENSRHHRYNYKVETTLHGEGCRTVLMDIYGEILLTVGLIAMGIAAVKTTVLLLFRLLHTNLLKAEELGDWTATTEAYIYFEKLDDDKEAKAMEGKEGGDKEGKEGKEGDETTDDDKETTGDETSGEVTTDTETGATTDTETTGATEASTTEGETTTASEAATEPTGESTDAEENAQQKKDGEEITEIAEGEANAKPALEQGDIAEPGDTAEPGEITSEPNDLAAPVPDENNPPEDDQETAKGTAEGGEVNQNANYDFTQSNNRWYPLRFRPSTMGSEKKVNRKYQTMGAALDTDKERGVRYRRKMDRERTQAWVVENMGFISNDDEDDSNDIYHDDVHNSKKVNMRDEAYENTTPSAALHQRHRGSAYCDTHADKNMPYNDSKTFQTTSTCSTTYHSENEVAKNVPRKRGPRSRASPSILTKLKAQLSGSIHTPQRRGRYYSDKYEYSLVSTCSDDDNEVGVNDEYSQKDRFHEIDNDDENPSSPAQKPTRSCAKRVRIDNKVTEMDDEMTFSSTGLQPCNESQSIQMEMSSDKSSVYKYGTDQEILQSLNKRSLLAQANIDAGGGPLLRETDQDAVREVYFSKVKSQKSGNFQTNTEEETKQREEPELLIDLSTPLPFKKDNATAQTPQTCWTESNIRAAQYPFSSSLPFKKPAEVRSNVTSSDMPAGVSTNKSSSFESEASPSVPEESHSQASWETRYRPRETPDCVGQKSPPEIIDTHNSQGENRRHSYQRDEPRSGIKNYKQDLPRPSAVVAPSFYSPARDSDRSSGSSHTHAVRADNSVLQQQQERQTFFGGANSRLGNIPRTRITNSRYETRDFPYSSRALPRPVRVGRCTPYPRGFRTSEQSADNESPSLSAGQQEDTPVLRHSNPYERHDLYVTDAPQNMLEHPCTDNQIGSSDNLDSDAEVSRINSTRPDVHGYQRFPNALFTERENGGQRNNPQQQAHLPNSQAHQEPFVQDREPDENISEGRREVKTEIYNTALGVRNFNQKQPTEETITSHPLTIPSVAMKWRYHRQGKDEFFKEGHAHTNDTSSESPAIPPAMTAPVVLELSPQGRNHIRSYQKRNIFRVSPLVSSRTTSPAAICSPAYQARSSISPLLETPVETSTPVLARDRGIYGQSSPLQRQILPTNHGQTFPARSGVPRTSNVNETSSDSSQIVAGHCTNFPLRGTWENIHRQHSLAIEEVTNSRCGGKNSSGRREVGKRDSEPFVQRDREIIPVHLEPAQQQKSPSPPPPPPPPPRMLPPPLPPPPLPSHPSLIPSSLPPQLPPPLLPTRPEDRQSTTEQGRMLISPFN